MHGNKIHGHQVVTMIMVMAVTQARVIGQEMVAQVQVGMKAIGETTPRHTQVLIMNLIAVQIQIQAVR